MYYLYFYSCYSSKDKTKPQTQVKIKLIISSSRWNVAVSESRALKCSGF